MGWQHQRFAAHSAGLALVLREPSKAGGLFPLEPGQPSTAPTYGAGPPPGLVGPRHTPPELPDRPTAGLMKFCGEGEGRGRNGRARSVGRPWPIHFLRVILAGSDLHSSRSGAMAHSPVTPHEAGPRAARHVDRAHETHSGQRHEWTPFLSAKHLHLWIRSPIPQRVVAPMTPPAGQVARSTASRTDSTNLARAGAGACLGHQTAEPQARPSGKGG